MANWINTYFADGRHQVIARFNVVERIVNLTHKDKLRWKLNRNRDIFMSQNVFKNVVCKSTFVQATEKLLEVSWNAQVQYFSENENSIQYIFLIQ